jgi:hypothetical protein
MASSAGDGFAHPIPVEPWARVGQPVAMRWIVFLTALLAAKISPAKTPEPLSKETRELFAWFDRLGFEDTSKAKYIRIRTGDSMKVNGTERQDDESLGWLLEDDGPTFRAVLADLTVGLFTKQGKQESETDFCGYREVALEDEARKLRSALKDANYFKIWDESSEFHYFDRIRRRTQIFALARSCAQRQLVPLAEDLLRSLAAHPMTDGLNRAKEKVSDWAIDDLERVLAWRLQTAFRSPTTTWVEILAGYQLHQELYTGCSRFGETFGAGTGERTGSTASR